MTNTPKEFFPSTLLIADPQILYQVPLSGTATIKTIRLHNTSNSPVTVTIYFVPNGESPSDSNQEYQRAIAGKDTKKLLELFDVTIGELTTIRASASVDNVVNIRGAGIETL